MLKRFDIIYTIFLLSKSLYTTEQNVYIYILFTYKVSDGDGVLFYKRGDTTGVEIFSTITLNCIDKVSVES